MISKLSKLRCIALLMAATFGVVGGAEAATLRYAGTTAPLTFDPHATNDFLTVSLVREVYDSVVELGPDMAPVPGIATQWTYMGNATWRFKIRQGVQFHDGTPLTAKDVAFSMLRQSKSGLYASLFGGITQARVVDASTVDVVTQQPDPILPLKMARLFVMSEAWCKQHDLLKTPDLGARGSEAYSLRHENGSGPMILTDQQPNVSTQFKRNDKWWGQFKGNVTDAQYRVIAAGPTRVAALLSDSLDLITDLPVQDVDRMAAMPAYKVEQGPQRLFMELEMDGTRAQALDTTDKAGNPLPHNPFAALAVRQAIAFGIDDNLLVKKVMRGHAYVIGTGSGRGFSGYQADLDSHWPYDPAKSKQLLAQAGYPAGFKTVLNCPVERYVNAEETCQAVANMLGKIGIDVRINDMVWSKFASMLVNGPNSSFHLIGAAGNSGDVQDTFVAIMATRNLARNRGLQNWAMWTDPDFDKVTDKLVDTFDPTQRNALYREGLTIAKDKVSAVYLYQPTLIWGMRKNIEIPVRADSTVVLENVVVH